jgi:hypothetical protein
MRQYNTLSCTCPEAESMCALNILKWSFFYDTWNVAINYNKNLVPYAVQNFYNFGSVNFCYKKSW